jgi:hypothetical protein
MELKAEDRAVAVVEGVAVSTAIAWAKWMAVTVSITADYIGPVIRVRYSGPVRGAHMLAAELSAAGLHVDFVPPEERRGVGHDLVHVMMQIGSEAEAGLIGTAAVATVQRVVRAFKERHPEVEADAENGGDEER